MLAEATLQIRTGLQGSSNTSYTAPRLTYPQEPDLAALHAEESESDILPFAIDGDTGASFDATSTSPEGQTGTSTIQTCQPLYYVTIGYKSITSCCNNSISMMVGNVQTMTAGGLFGMTIVLCIGFKVAMLLQEVCQVLKQWSSGLRCIRICMQSMSATHHQSWQHSSTSLTLNRSLTVSKFLYVRLHQSSDSTAADSGCTTHVHFPIMTEGFPPMLAWLSILGFFVVKAAVLAASLTLFHMMPVYYTVGHYN